VDTNQIKAHVCQINNQHRAIQREFEHVARTLLKNTLGVRWGLLPILWWVGSWLPTYLNSFFRQVKRIFCGGNRIANHFIWKWVPLHYHPCLPTREYTIIYKSVTLLVGCCVN
jgi:hypothetical protein